MYYLIYDKKTGYIAYITEFEDQVYYDENTQNVFTTETLPDWFNDITKRPIVKNGEIIEDPTFIYLTPEQLQLQQAKNAKLEEIKQIFESKFIDGHFYSQTLQIEVDCRRTGIKNDLQNVENLIGYLETSNQTELNIYRGYTNPETSITQYAYNVTLEQLQQLKLEMIQYGLQLYNRKWQLEDLINNTSTLSDLNNISIDFTIH